VAGPQKTLRISSIVAFPATKQRGGQGFHNGEKKLSAAALEFFHQAGRRGGKKGGAAGGKAVASKMTQEELRARSLKRLAARWGKKKSG